MDAICNPARGNRRLKTRMLMLAALAAAGFGGAAAAQSLQPETIAAIPADRLCTAGFNPDYGWFDVDSIGFGVLEFPGWDCLPYDRVSPKPEVVSERMATLSTLAAGTSGPRVVVATVSAALQRVPGRFPEKN